MLARSPEVIPCPQPPLQNKHQSRRCPLKDAFGAEPTSSTYSAAIKQALKSKIGSQPKRTFFAPKETPRVDEGSEASLPTGDPPSY
jgi:hypothetical protein